MKKNIYILSIIISIGLLMFIFNEKKQEEYIVEDNYKIMISYPIIDNKNIKNKINNFVESNKKIYIQNKDSITNMVINYEKQEYKNIVYIGLYCYIYYEDDYEEKSEIIAYKKDNYEYIKLKDLFSNPYYVSDITKKLVNLEVSNNNLNYITVSKKNNFILNEEGLTIKYNFLNKIKELKISYEEINEYLKEEYRCNILDLLPKTNSIKRDLSKYKGKKLIALTFDDGPSYNTEKLLNELKKRDVKVTFFVLGSRVNSFKETLKRAYEEGHQIGSHTYSHKNLFYLSEEEIEYEILKTNEVIYNTIGVNPTIIRVPYGNINDKIRNASDMYHILWNVDTLDWKYKNTNSVYKRIIKKAGDGNIILLHDIFKTSINGAIKAIDELKKQGYEFVTIDEMAYLKGIKLDKSKTYFNF